MPGATLGAVPLTSLKERIAVVTGGASGIGRALALLFAREGAHVVVADLDEAGMAETVAVVVQAGRRGLAVKTDVSHLADVPALACENRSSDHWSFVRGGLVGVRVGSTPYAEYHSPADLPPVVDPAQLRRTGRVVLAWLSPRVARAARP